jgi:sugar/nucleoside kinase (ribokinase family)
VGKRIDILGLGAVAVDDFIFVEAYPQPDAKARVLLRERYCGGLTAIALVTAARLGACCAYSGVLGNDDASSFACRFLKQEKIELRWMKRLPNARPISSNIVVDQGRGTRNIFFHIGHGSGAPKDLPARLINSCRVLFIDHVGVPGMIRAARLAKRAGIPSVADFECDDHPRFAELLGLADHLILSRGFALKLTGKRAPEKMVRALAKGAHEVVVVTSGDLGYWYMNRGSTRPVHQPAFKVAAVDTTGCGDVFHGAYAYGLAQDMQLEERLRLASAAAALKASCPAGPAGIPSMASVRRFLNS